MQAAGLRTARNLIATSLHEARTAVADLGLPLIVLLAGAGRWRTGPPDRQLLVRLNLGLVVMRYGVAAGMRRAYRETPPTYWLSPLFDPAVCVKIWIAALRRTHQWRGRPIVRASSQSAPPSGEASLT